MLCVHGALDEDVPMEFSEAYAAARGAELRRFADEDHYGHIEPDNPMWRCAAEWLDAVAG